MPTSVSGRDSRRSSRSSQSRGETHKSTSDRRSKGRSAQTFDERRRASQQTENGSTLSAERPAWKSRTNSAPIVETDKEPGVRKAVEAADKRNSDELDYANSPVDGGVTSDGQDEDELAGVTGALKQLPSFQGDELSVPLPDLTIAIIGAEQVGKSTLMKNALDLTALSESQAIERKIEIFGTDYLLRLLEISIDDIEIDDDDAVSWPETIEGKVMPHIDGAVTLYDVKDQSSLENVPEILNAISKAEIPSLLMSSKCDTPSNEREVNPRSVELVVKRKVKDLLDALQASINDVHSHKKAISMVLEAIVTAPPDKSISKDTRLLSPSRRRAQSTAINTQPIRPRNDYGHSRATSEYTGSLHKEQAHYRHDSSLAPQASNDRLKPPTEMPQEDVHGSFLIEESPSEASDDTSVSSEAALYRSIGEVKPQWSAGEEGVSFEELVDRLLAQPKSKADNKFAAIFLALYRKFAPPGQLLEAVVQRFDELERKGDACLITTTSQLRHLSIMEQWVGTYPGDFAYRKTRRRMQTFIAKLSESRIFASAAKEMSAHIDAAHEDDDTNWAYCDRDRKSTDDDFRISLSSTASILLDDPAFLDRFSAQSTLVDDDTDASTRVGSSSNLSRASTLLSQHTANAQAAKKQANLLHPIPRQPISKIHWRALYEYTDEGIARELTRIDWIMFSSIRPRDLVRHVSLNKKQSAECKDLVFVNRMIDHFNQVALWVENFILLRDKPKHRALMLEKFMKIARKLREMNNYNSLGAIIAGVKSSAVHRLAATRELIPPAVGRDWMKLDILMAQTGSHKAYRLAWENSNSERIPYLPLHRRDLVSAEAGNKTFVGDESNGKINWKKFEIVGEVIVSMQRAQSVPYRGLTGVRGNEELKELILDVKLVKDEDDLFARSKQVEPSGTPAIGTTAKFKELFKR